MSDAEKGGAYFREDTVIILVQYLISYRPMHDNCTYIVYLEGQLSMNAFSISCISDTEYFLFSLPKSETL